MALITVNRTEYAAVVHLDNGVPNAISPEMVAAIADAVRETRDASLGLVLAGNAKFFSMGFDLPAVLRLDRPGMTEFFRQFNQLTLDIITHPAPTAAAVRGHAVAGGAILALAAGHRFMAAGEKKFGLNEVKLGVPVPILADMLLRQITTERTATRLLFEGRFITAREAAMWGIADGVFPEKYVEDETIRHVESLAQLPRHAFSAIKDNRVASLVERYRTLGAAKDEILLDCWFRQATRERLLEAAEKFRQP